MNSEAQKFQNSGASVKLNNTKRRSNLMFQAETPKDVAFRKITDTISRDAGKYVSFSEPDNIIGLFVGACTYESWPSFIIIDKDRKIQFVRSDTTYKIEKNIPACLSILDYIKNHDSNCLKELVDNTVKAHNLEVLSDIIINRGFTNNNNKRKNNKKK